MVLSLDPGTFWLNVMNWGLGAFTAAIIVAVVVGVLRAAHHPKHHVATAGAGIWLHSFDHVGLTMADGGEPVEPQPPAEKPAGN
jgi:hypothetical protein